jgi:hypothetical protein
MEQSKAMEYESRKVSSDVLKPRNIYIYIYKIIDMIATIQSENVFFNIKKRKN